MTATVATVAYRGLEARPVEVQVQLSAGLPRFTIGGLPDKAVAESRERVHAALASIGLALPPKRITVNLSPADLPKEGSHFDLSIALCLLAAIGAADAEALSHYVIVGELKLDGRIASSPGVLLAALQASAEGKGLFVPSPKAPRQPGRATWRSLLRRTCWRFLLTLREHPYCNRRSREWRRILSAVQTLGRLKDRKSPSVRSRLRRPAVTIC